MAFQDDFASALTNLGIPVDASVIPSQDVLQTALDSLATWLNSLDDVTRSTVDSVTGDFPVKFGLSDPTVNIAPGLSDLLKKCDNLNLDLPISTILDKCKTALSQITP
jgi:hypothetical protein